MKIPNEITIYAIDLIVSPLDSPDDHFIRAEWMGYFTTEDLAKKAAKEAFGEHKTIVFDWEIYPLVLTIHGGDIKNAKVEHECCECEGKIERGQSYMKCVGKWEGEIDTFNVCNSCCAIGTDLLGGCWSFGDMWNRIQECYGLEEEALPQSLIDYRKEWKARLKEHGWTVGKGQ